MPIKSFLILSIESNILSLSKTPSGRKLNYFSLKFKGWITLFILSNKSLSPSLFYTLVQAHTHTHTHTLNFTCLDFKLTHTLTYIPTHIDSSTARTLIYLPIRLSILLSTICIYNCVLLYLSCYLALFVMADHRYYSRRMGLLPIASLLITE